MLSQFISYSLHTLVYMGDAAWLALPFREHNPVSAAARCHNSGIGLSAMHLTLVVNSDSAVTAASARALRGPLLM